MNAEKWVNAGKEVSLMITQSREGRDWVDVNNNYVMGHELKGHYIISDPHSLLEDIF